MEQHAPSLSTTYILSPVVQQLIAQDRERGHVHIMSAYRTGLGPSPREKLSLLWHINPKTGQLIIQANEAPLWPGKLGELQSSIAVQPPPEGGIVDLIVERSCQKTPPSRTPEPLRAELERRGPDGNKLSRAYRSRPVIVPESERKTWAAGRLSAIGLEPLPETIQLGKLTYASLGARKRGIPYIEIRARARVVDAGEFATALVAGTGKGRNYGLGLIRIQTITA